MLAINGILNLVFYVLLLSIPCGILFCLFAAYRNISRRFSTKAQKIALIIAIFGVVVAITSPALIGWINFKNYCSNPLPIRLTSGLSKPDSILLLYSASNGFADNSRPPSPLLGKDFSRFEKATILNGEWLQGHEAACSSIFDCKYSKNLQSQYYFTITLPQETKEIFGNFNKFSRMQVVNKKNGVVVAERSEAIFGGGLIGLYLSALGGDPDYGYLGCGYISNNPVPWRPRRGLKREVEEYIEADRRFLSQAFISPSEK